ncbi:molybdopterin-guanine dinucleotide biosynthesis protein B [Chloroflexota bacterium]
MPPVISIVGRSKSGKTTFIVKLVAELKSRGYRVATCKHAPEGVDLNDRDKDNRRHLNAGSEVTALSSADKIVVIKPVQRDSSLEDVVRFFNEDYDIVLAEGFKQSSAPKIEVHRQEVGPPLSSVRKRIAIATDEPLELKARQLSLEDTPGFADLLEEGFIKPQRERVSLYVNNAPITLTTFPRKFIASVVLGMVSGLKGVGKVSRIDLFLRK